MTPYKLVFATSVLGDFDRIAEHLFRSYVNFGDMPWRAFDRTETRISEIRGFIRKLESTPHQGTTRDDLMVGLRILPDRRNAAIAFKVNDQKRIVKVLRVFFGGEDYEAVIRCMEGDA